MNYASVSPNWDAIRFKNCLLDIEYPRITILRDEEGEREKRRGKEGRKGKGRGMKGRDS